MPPSSDVTRPKRNRSLRKKSDRKPGGQPGHKGKTLEMKAVPDHIVDLVPGYCKGCGLSLEGVPLTLSSSRQVVDLPPIKAVYTEYRSHQGQCPCGCRTVADFPEGATSPVSYGSHMEGLIGYFHAGQYLPFARMREMMADVFNIDISEGGLHYLLDRFANRAAPLYDMVKQRVAASKVVGTDETGAKVNGDKHWFWTWQTPKPTYIAHGPTRGRSAIQDNFPQGFPDATLVHDGWRARTGTPAKHHQTCLPHLLGRLNYLNEKYHGTDWGKSFKAMLHDAMELKKDGAVKTGNTQRAEILQRPQGLLERPPDKKHRELFTFYKRMCRERQHLFIFLFIEDVPPDNNASERAIGNIKVKQKISGQFKTERAAKNFAKIRSVIDTTIKNGMNVMEALALIAKLQPQYID